MLEDRLREVEKSQLCEKWDAPAAVTQRNLAFSVIMLVGILLGAPAIAAAVLQLPGATALHARGGESCAAAGAGFAPPLDAPAVAPASPGAAAWHGTTAAEVEDVAWAVVSRPSATNFSASTPRVPSRRTSSAQPERQARVKRALQHAWAAYVRHAWGQDEVDPVRQIGVKSFGMATTLIDSLDTLCAPSLSPHFPQCSPRRACHSGRTATLRACCSHLVGLDTEFRQGVSWVAESLHFGDQEDINVFEVTIRVLGGLLSAYELSAEPVLLEREEQLANQAPAAPALPLRLPPCRPAALPPCRPAALPHTHLPRSTTSQLLFAFQTPTGLPFGTVGLRSRTRHNPTWSKGASTVAEVATLQLEFRVLSRHTSNAAFEVVAQRVMRHLRQMPWPAELPRGLYPTFISPTTGDFASSEVTLGARYEGRTPSPLSPTSQPRKNRQPRHRRAR